MKNKNNQIIVITSVLCLLPIIMSFVVYNDLPEQIAIHWDSSGNPNNFAPKAFAAFGLPIFFLIINLFSKMRLFNDPKRSNTSQVMQVFAAWVIPILSLILVPITLFIAMGVDIPISLITTVLVAIIFIICGNYLPKSRQNYTVGIKLPWTLHNADNWNKTHRMAGYLWILGGIILLVGIFISTLTPFDNKIFSFSITIFVIILLAIVPFIYSWLLYKKSEKNIDKIDD